MKCPRKKFMIVILLILVSAWIFTSLHSKGICLPNHGQEVVKRICTDFTSNQISGNICQKICDNDIIIQCNGYHGGKSHVLKVESYAEIFILKSTSQSNLDPWDPNLSSEDLLATILTKLRLDFSHYSPDSVLSYVKTYDLSSPVIRHDIWHLANDHEFLMSLLLHHFEVFPKFLGHCGSFYAVEYVETLDNIINSETLTHLATVNLVKEIVNFVEKFKANNEELFLCDVKTSHFGKSPTDVWKYVDLDSVFPRTMLERNIRLRSTCIVNSADCNFFDCKSSCNEVTKKCDQPISSTNLQVICANILVGGIWFNRGLLNSGQFDQLQESLRKCISDISYTEKDLILALEAIS